MVRSVLVKVAITACIGLALLPATASAQSGITGVARDATGAVLPGVTVEAASPALIEGVRTAATDEGGRYAIVNLRPGLYKVTFSLAGFSTSVRDGVDLPSNFTATINAELKVGNIEESVTVTGAAPVVDVQNAQRTTVINRDLLDAVPMPRMFVAEAAMVVGTKMNSQNVGGTRAAVNPRLTAHGSVTKDTTIDVDGMKMNTLVGGGDSHPDHNDAMTQETTVQVASLGAEVSAGGPHVNLIPRTGGNTFSGATYFGYSTAGMQTDNLSQDLINRGLATPDAVKYVYDYNVSVGGPIKHDKLWFFGSWRKLGNQNKVANSFYPDGSPGIYDQYVSNYTARLTWQVNSKNKVTAYDDFQTKDVGHLLTPDVSVEASLRRPPVLKYTGAAKWTSIMSNKLMFELGYGTSVNAYTEKYQPGVEQVPFTPAWYATASRYDLITLKRTVAGTRQTGTYNFRYMVVGSMNYVTGSHAVKAGVQWHWGEAQNTAQGNADLIQQYRSGVPDSVIVANTPARRIEDLRDIGVYLQDSWTHKRLTVNPGVRLEFFNSSIQANTVEAGRFVPVRSFPLVSDTPNWFNVAPRFSMVYDLTGDTKTALKVGINKYYRNYTVDFAQQYNPFATQTDTRNWSDCDYNPGTSTCSSKVLATNKDNIAQDNEIGPSNNKLFGLAPARHADPDIKRPYDIEFMVAVDRQVISGVSVTGAWYRRLTRDLSVVTNLLTSVSDYAPFTTPNPVSGEPVTIYNLNKAKQGQVDLLDTSTSDTSQASSTYSGFEVSFAAQLPGGGKAFGGWSTEKIVAVSCGGYDPNTFRYCDQRDYDMPYRSDLKFAGSYPLPLGLSLGATYASYAGVPLAVNWSVPSNLFPGGRTQSVTVNLVPPGSKYLNSWTQLDLSVHKALKIRNVRVDGAVDMYNALNNDVVLLENQSYGSSLGNPQQILQGRLLRVSLQMKF